MHTIGILGLQGAFAKHQAVLKRLNTSIQSIRFPKDLDGCDGLIIPGGESTTMTKLIAYIGIREPLLKFAKQKPILGTCAGMIIMAKNVADPKVQTLELMDIEVERNAYGRQVDSFVHSLEIFTNGKSVSMRGVFIRAPRIKSVGDKVEILAALDGEPVFVRQGHYLATSFHPELSESTAIHDYFLSLVKEHIFES